MNSLPSPFSSFDIFAGCLFPHGDGAETLTKIPNVTILNFDVTNKETISTAVAQVTEKIQVEGKGR